MVLVNLVMSVATVGGCVVFFLVARFAILLTAGCTCMGLDTAIEFFNNIHERALLHSLCKREFMSTGMKVS